MVVLCRCFVPSPMIPSPSRQILFISCNLHPASLQLSRWGPRAPSGTLSLREPPTNDRYLLVLLGGTCLHSSQVEAGWSQRMNVVLAPTHHSFNTEMLILASMVRQPASDHPFRHNLVSLGASRPGHDHQIAILPRLSLWNTDDHFQSFWEWPG